MLMPLAQIGLPSALLKFFPELKDKEAAKHQLLSFALIGTFVGFLLLTVVLWLFQGPVVAYFSVNASELNEYYHVVTALILVFAVHSIFETYSRILLKIIAINLIKEVLVRVLLSLAVTLYFLQFISFEQMVNGLLVIHLIALVSLLGYIHWIGQLRLSPKFDQLEGSFIKKLINYSLFIIIGASAGNIVLNIDQLMVSSMLGLDENGIYSTVFYFGVMIELSRRVISQITTPLISSSFEQNNSNAIIKIYRQTSINQMIIGSLFFIGLVCNIDRVFDLMPNGEIFRAGKYVVYIIGLSKLLDMTFANNSEIIVMSNHYKFNVITIGFLAVLVVLFNYLLIPEFGLNGAALASMLAMLLFNLAKFIFIKLKLGYHPFTGKTLIHATIIAFTLLIGFNVPYVENAFLDIAIRSAIICMIFGSLVYFLKVSAEVNGLINKLMGHISRRS